MSIHLLIRFLTLIGIAYAGYCLLVFLLQRQIIYPGRSIRVSGQAPAGIENIPILTTSGKGNAWLIMPGMGKQGERRPLVVFFHGNGEVIDFLPEQVEGFRLLGMAVLLVEYPGFGRSEGSPTEGSIIETSVAAYDAAVKRDDVDPKRIVAFGRSLGGGAACALAAQRPTAALILQSTFTSTRPFARSFLAPAFLLRDVFDNSRILASYRKPVLLFHGSYDTIIPPEHGRELQRIAPNARLIELPCNHNDLPPDWREFYRIIAAFLKESDIL